MELNVIGKNILRVDAYSKVTGKAVYPQDIYLNNMVYGKTLRSKLPHAKIKVDITESEKVEGVLKVFTFKDVPKENSHGVVIKDHEVFASEKVIRIGEPIAFIVGETQKACDEGYKKIKVDYEELPAVFDPREAMNEDSPKVHGNSNIVFHYKLRHGDIEEGKRKCKYIVENVYKSPMVEHAFLQPEAGVSYVEEDGTVVVAVATQYPHYDREEVARNLGLPEKKVKIINTAVGGAFGGREDISPQIHLALAAMVLNRPVKVIYSREESFLTHSKRHPMIMKYKTGADENGILQYMETEIIGDSGAHCSWAINVLRKAGVHATGPYVIPNVKVDTYAVYTNNPFTGAMRGFGATQVPIAHEQQMDMLAEKLGMDPIEIRMKNIFRKGSMTATGQMLIESVPLDKCIEKVEEDFGFSRIFGEVLA
ncbi:molybdopterin cofactor-binding domain-containing protein [Tissierella praeacuta]|uniref:xanthine dehydrogenase family protein molybdopterin-binding subunit n=1 Tax=Tissierella praeacuta TaxID=43131 RepID=UPI00333EDA0F